MHVGLAPTAAVSTTSRITARKVPFGHFAQRQARTPIAGPPHSPPTDQASATLPQPPLLPLSPSRHTPVANLTTPPAGARHVASVTSAAGVETTPMARGPVPDPPPPPPPNLPINQQRLVTPLQPLELERELASYPDKGFVSQLLHNITHGCDIGYNGPHFSHTANHLVSAHTHPHVISEALTKECMAGRLAGPYSSPPLPNLRCSGLGAVPKKDGDWRVIYHLSAPPGSSINDFIDPNAFSLHYCTIDAAIAILNTL